MADSPNPTSVNYVYGYGSAKHIAGADGKSLCGAAGGYPLIAEHRPVCKRCAKRAQVAS